MKTSKTKPLRILWIEDQLPLIKPDKILLARLTESEGGLGAESVEFISARWVAEAEEKLNELRNNPPDLIILDSMLSRTKEQFDAKPPKIDINAGYLLWHRLRQQAHWGESMKKLPIIFLTALSPPIFAP